ncbi:hypothetical protein [Acetobacterium woodii]|uniref:Uncharacterized protein n=1 Tax=Acetobacterium woodii (strain ATCC 29683 / DSM 1030 / JCM 2381 / KCTC 1655 / WB1) TaxID=931626 RepID=H6LIM2_ACEWD|nr:hypothetical protein [Acetobacterium woodii]AFA48596.1 hypothetical protein Awo_c18160 [Acetobacterium woodii DSM 1030]
MDQNKNQRNKKETLIQWSYTILIWVLPFLYLTIFPWILNQTRFLARNELSFGPNASMFYQNLTVFILPIAFNLFIGAGVFILVFGIKKYQAKAIMAGCILGVFYALLIVLSYPIYFNFTFVFNINLQLVNQIFRLGMYNGPGNASFILAFYGLLLYQIIKQYRLSK